MSQLDTIQEMSLKIDKIDVNWSNFDVDQSKVDEKINWKLMWFVTIGHYPRNESEKW